MKLTKNEQDVLDLIRENNHISMKDMAEKLNKPSTNSIHFLVHTLEKKGEIKIEGKKTTKIYIPLRPYSSTHSLNYGQRFFGQYILDRNGTSNLLT